jgi:hypothetical protein
MYFHFLLDQKVKQKIKSHRPEASGRSGKIFSWTSCGKFRFARNDKRFPHAVFQSKFFLSSLPRCDGVPYTAVHCYSSALLLVRRESPDVSGGGVARLSRDCPTPCLGYAEKQSECVP